MNRIEAQRTAGLLGKWGFREIEYVATDTGSTGVSAVGDMGFRQIWWNLAQVEATREDMAFKQVTDTVESFTASEG